MFDSVKLTNNYADKMPMEVKKPSELETLYQGTGLASFGLFLAGNQVYEVGMQDWMRMSEKGIDCHYRL